MVDIDNSQFLEGIRRKNVEILKSIYREFFPMVRRFVLDNQGTSQDAEDLFQNALEAIYLKVREDQLVLTAKFSTYLFELCRRQWYKKFRRKKFESSVTMDDPMVLREIEAAMPILEQTERYQLYREKFGGLGADCQEILTLTLVEERDFREVTAIMQLSSEGFARKKKHDCKEKLLKSIRQDPRFQELKS